MNSRAAIDKILRQVGLVINTAIQNPPGRACCYYWRLYSHVILKTEGQATICLSKSQGISTGKKSDAQVLMMTLVQQKWYAGKCLTETSHLMAHSVSMTLYHNLY